MGELPIMTDPIHTFGVRPHQRANSKFQIPSSKFPALQAQGASEFRGGQIPKFQIPSSQGRSVRVEEARFQVPSSQVLVRETRGVKFQVPASLKALVSK